MSVEDGPPAVGVASGDATQIGQVVIGRWGGVHIVQNGGERPRGQGKRAVEIP